jgi:hypothetical protein
MNNKKKKRSMLHAAGIWSLNINIWYLSNAQVLSIAGG